jgi:phosphoserine phosphatase
MTYVPATAWHVVQNTSLLSSQPLKSATDAAHSAPQPRMDAHLSDSLEPEVWQCLAPYLDGRRRGAIAFDADGTLWRGDVGEDLLLHLDQAGVLPGSFAHYEQLVTQHPEEAFAFAVEVMEGMTEDDVLAHTEAALGPHPEGRAFPFVPRLLRALERAGNALWVVSASPFWPVRATANGLGIPAERILAVRCDVREGRLRGPARRPVTAMAGKAEALHAHGVFPEVAFGNTALDIPLLEAARHGVVVLPAGDVGKLAHTARDRKWAIQWV